MLPLWAGRRHTCSTTEWERTTRGARCPMGPGRDCRRAPEIATPIAEMAIRPQWRACRTSGTPLAPGSCGRTDEAGAAHHRPGVVDGRRISDLLVSLEARDCGCRTRRRWSWLHDRDGGALAARDCLATSCHGALSPAHMSSCEENGQLLLTEAVFGEAVTRARHSRERLWRERAWRAAGAGEPVLDQRGISPASGPSCWRSCCVDGCASRVSGRSGRPHDGGHCRLPEWGLLLRRWLQQALQLSSGFTSSAARCRGVCRGASGGAPEAARRSSSIVRRELFSPVRVG